MNEIFACKAMIYFKTKATSAKQGFDELLDVAAKNGIEIYAADVELRDADGNRIANCDGNL